MASYKKHARTRSITRETEHILYKNPLPNCTYFINRKNCNLVNKVSPQPFLRTSSRCLEYNETKVNIDKSFTDFRRPDNVIIKLNTPIECKIMRYEKSKFEMKTKVMLPVSMNERLVVIPSISKSLSIDFYRNINYSRYANTGESDINCLIYGNAVCFYAYSDGAAIMFLNNISIFELHLNNLRCKNVSELGNQIYLCEERKRHEDLFKFTYPDNILNEIDSFTWRKYKEHYVPSSKDTIKLFGVKQMECNVQYNKNLRPYILHWHIQNIYQGYRLRAFLWKHKINTLYLIKNNYFLIINKAKVKAAIDFQPKNFIIAFCINQTSFLARFCRVDMERKICTVYTSLNCYVNPKGVTKKDRIIIETLKTVMYSRESTSSANILRLKNYSQSRNKIDNIPLYDLKRSEMYMNGGFNTFAVISIDNILTQHYKIMQKQHASELCNINETDKLHCNSALLVGKLWLRNLFENYKYIIAHINMTNKPDFINETMFDTPLLDRYVVVASKYYNIITAHRNLLKLLGQNFIHVIFNMAITNK